MEANNIYEFMQIINTATLLTAPLMIVFLLKAATQVR